MPIFNRFFITGDKPIPLSLNPEHLFKVGPRIPIEVLMPMILENTFTQVGTPVPNPVSGYGLIDTGATITAVDRDILSNLGISPIGRTKVLTPQGEEEQLLYPIRLRFPNSTLPEINFSRVTGSKLQHQGIIALIGRDVLVHFLFIYNGTTGQITISY